MKLVKINNLFHTFNPLSNYLQHKIKTKKLLYYFKFCSSESLKTIYCRIFTKQKNAFVIYIYSFVKTCDVQIWTFLNTSLRTLEASRIG